MASIVEDGLVVGGLALALAHPWLALILVLGTSIIGAVVVWLVWRTLWRGIKRLFATPASMATPLPGGGDHSLPPAP
ncbi:hypothetical protein D3C81_657390 [compost metagenome]